MREEEISRLNIKNYQIISFYSRKKSVKGGVLILSGGDIEWGRVDLPASLKDDLLEEKNFEFCASAFEGDDYKFVVVGIYRSPGSNVKVFVDRLSILCGFLCKKYTHVVVGGDINIDVLKNDNKHKLLKDMLISHGMVYLVDFPTRVTEDSISAIDNFLIKNTDLSEISAEGVITCLSDHDGQILTIKHPVNKIMNNPTIKREIRRFSQDNITFFSTLLRKESWQEVYHVPVEEKFDVFYATFRFYFEQAFPKVWVTKINKKKILDN